MITLADTPLPPSHPHNGGTAAGGYFDRVRRALLEKAVSLSYDVIDLDPFFFEHYRRTGERVEFARDGHWTGVYHGVAFDAVMASPFMVRLVSERDHAAETHRMRASYSRYADASLGRPDHQLGVLNRPAISEIVR